MFFFFLFVIVVDMWNCAMPNGVPTLACIVPLYQRGLSAAIGLIGVASLFMIIFAGIKYITSGGGKQVDEAKNIFTYAIIGLIITLLSFFIVSILAKIAGVDCILTFGFGSCK